MNTCPECREESYEETKRHDGSKYGRCWSCDYRYHEPPDPKVKETDENWIEDLPKKERKMLLEESEAETEEELVKMAEEGKTMKEILGR